MSNPDVKRTKEWEPWGPDDLISEWRENGVDEQILNNVVQGLQFQPNGLGLLGHKISHGIAYIDGYRVKYDGVTEFDLAATTYYRFYAVLKVTADPSGGVSAAWIEIEMKTGLSVDPPTDRHILLGIVLTTGGGVPIVPMSQIWWHDNYAHAPEIFDAGKQAYKNIFSFERPFLPVAVGPMIGSVTPLFYYKMEEALTQSLESYWGTNDLIIPDPVNPYVRPCKGRRGRGQLFDAYANSQAYRKSVNPTFIIADGQALDHNYWFSIWAYPQRKDVDMSLMFKLYDFRLTWLTATNQLEFEVGDGVAAWTRSVLSQALPDFENKMFHICFGYDVATDKHWIIVNNGPVQWEVGAGVRAPGINDFFMGNNDTWTLPFYGIMDEFFKFNIPFYRHHIEELYNYGLGNIFKINFDTLPQIVSGGYFAGQAIGAGAQSKLDINGVAGDSRFIDFANDWFIDPTLTGISSGLYLVHVRTTIDAAPADSRFRIGLKVNAAWVAFEEVQSSIVDDISLSCTALVNLSAGLSNTIEFWVYNPGGVGINLLGGIAPTEFSVLRLR